MTEGTDSRLIIGRMDDLAAAVREIRSTQTDAQKTQHQTALTVERIAAKLDGVTALGERVEELEDAHALNEVRLKILEQPSIAITGRHEERIHKLETLVTKVFGGIVVIVALLTLGRELLRLFFH